MTDHSPPAKNPPEMKTDTLPDLKTVEEKEEKQFVVQIKTRGAVGGMKLC